MEVVLRLLIELRLVLIAIVAICCAAFLFTGLSSLRELRRAMFRLERSAIVNRIADAWVKAGLFAILGLAIWIVTDTTPASEASSGASENPLAFAPTVELNVAEPTPIPTADLAAALSQTTATPAEVLAAVVTVDPNAPLPTPVILPTATPAPLPTPIPPTATPAVPPTPTQPPPQEQLPFIVVVTATPEPAAAVPPPQPTATPVLPPTPTPTEAPTVPPANVLGADCPNPAARIDSPAAGEIVSGIYVVRGTADFPGGVGRYKLEILRPNIPGWAFLWENYNAVKNGVLMPRFDASLFPPGIYTLRLSLIDAAGQETGIYCSVQIRIA